MRRLLLLALLAAAPATARADEALLVWNDPDRMAIRLARFETRDPENVKAVVDLEPLKTISSTMTGVSSDGKYIGLCHQLQDGNEAPAVLKGFDAKGKERWRVFPSSLHAALTKALKPLDLKLMDDPNWLTFSCENAGATGKPGELAFDIGISAQRKSGETGGDWVEITMRLHLSGKSGKVIEVAGTGPQGASLTLGPNPVAPLHRDPATGQTFYIMTDGGFVIPEGGSGRALWSETPIRWQGAPVGDGSDFSWFVPAD